jgi:ElaA protein
MCQKGIHIKKCKSEYPDQTIFLQAQHRLKTFYELFGFKVVSDIYDDAGIDHIDMELTY